MASSLRSWSLCFLMASILAISSKSTMANFQPSPWQLAHATFYGDETASETMGMLFTVFCFQFVVLSIFLIHLHKNEIVLLLT